MLVPQKAGQTPDPKPCAGNDGTTIVVCSFFGWLLCNQSSTNQIEDMFYNTPTRLSALRSSSEEYARILDVVTRYAVHNPKVAFLCKKVCRVKCIYLLANHTEQAGSVTPELSTSSTSTDQTIRLLYGHTIGKELLHIEVSSSPIDRVSRSTGSGDVDDTEKWSAEAYCTSPNYQAKKTVFLLFINREFAQDERQGVRLVTIIQTVSSNRPASSEQLKVYTAGYCPKVHPHSYTSGTNDHPQQDHTLKTSALR